MDEEYRQLVEGGFVPLRRGGDWIEKAANQHNPKLTVTLAQSAEVVLPRRLNFLDFYITVKEEIDGRYN